MSDSGIADSRICSRCGSNDNLDAGHGLINRRCIPARTVCGGISAGDASLTLVFHPFHSRCLSACTKTGYNIGSVRWLFSLNLSAWRENWLLRWVNPALAYLSDDFGNNRRLMSLGWNRLFWLLLLGGIWCLCLLCTRRYGRGAFGSLLRNARMIYLPVIGIMLTITGVLVYVKQPFWIIVRRKLTMMHIIILTIMNM